MFVVCLSLFILPLLLAKISKWLLHNDTQTQDFLKEDRNNAVAVEDFAALSKRENQIAQLLLKGYTRQLIASELAISETTVKTHIHNIYLKLEISSKTELIQKIHHI
jgi:DNA-binding NarL/FixJ family response regulator